jgi:hypothetical protein
VLRSNPSKAFHRTYQYSVLVTLPFIGYSCYAVIDLAYVHDYLLNVVLFSLALPVCVLLTKANRNTHIERSRDGLPMNRSDQVAKLWYLSNLSITLVIASTVANISVVMFLALQLFAFITDAFFTRDEQRRYILIGSLLLTSIYVTGFFLRSFVSEGSLILLSFYGSWLSVMVAYYGKTP